MGRNFLSNPIIHHSTIRKSFRKWTPTVASLGSIFQTPDLHHARSVYWRSSSLQGRYNWALSWKFETIWRAKDAPISSSTPGSFTGLVGNSYKSFGKSSMNGWNASMTFGLFWRKGFHQYIDCTIEDLDDCWRWFLITFASVRIVILWWLGGSAFALPNFTNLPVFAF